jgi:hypothetical protein
VLLGREVNVVHVSRDELRRRMQTGSGFLGRVLAAPKRWLVGDEATLGVEHATGAAV